MNGKHSLPKNFHQPFFLTSNFSLAPPHPNGGKTALEITGLGGQKRQ
jgi:hypothetical protein